MWGRSRTSIEVGISLGLEGSIDTLLERVRSALEHGYRRIKLKIKPSSDIDPVVALRRELGDFTLSVDANGAYESHKLDIWRRFDAQHLVMIEQPFPASMLLEHVRLQERIQTPVCLDESITSTERAEEAIHLGAGRVLCVKPSLVGGFEIAAGIARMCAERGVDAWVGGMLETGIGKAINVHLASLPGFSMPADISGTDRYFIRDVLKSPITVSRGSICVPAAPGLGWAVDEVSVAELTIESRQITG